MSSTGKTKNNRKSVRKAVSKAGIREQRGVNTINKMSYDDARDEWMLSFWVDDEGIGNIQLPPDLSSLLQSETVTASPSGGGLFIRSI